jgi:hypothetical protein
MATAAKLAVGTTAVVGVVAMTAAPGRAHGPEPATAPPIERVRSAGEVPSAPSVAAELPPAPVIDAPAPVSAPRRAAGPRTRTNDDTNTPDRGDETAWLSEAAASLRADDPATALAQTDRHARRYPDSALGDVRAELRIEALCRLGRAAQARGEAAAWLRRAPESPIARRAAAICGPSPSP